MGFVHQFSPPYIHALEDQHHSTSGENSKIISSINPLPAQKPKLINLAPGQPAQFDQAL